MHYSYAQTPRRQVKVMELKEVFQFVSPQVRGVKRVEVYLEQVAADLRPLFAESVDEALAR